MSSLRPSSARRLLDALPGVSIALVSASVIVEAVTQVVGTDELSTDFALPWWSTMGAAGLATVAIVAKDPSRIRVAAWASAGAVLVLTAVFRLPYDLLSVLSAVIASVTGAEPYFDVAPAWGATGRHAVAGFAAAATVATAVVEHRRARGACGWCGARPGSRVVRSLRRPAVAAAVAVVAPIPYLSLKTAWAFGSDLGLEEQNAFEGVVFFTPGFGDTVLLGSATVLAALWMLVGRTGGPARWIAASIGTVAVSMLVPVGVLGVLMSIAAGLGFASTGTGLLQFWVFTIVYPTFAVWGIALAVATAGYWRRTRPPCPLGDGREHRDTTDVRMAAATAEQGGAVR